MNTVRCYNCRNSGRIRPRRSAQKTYLSVSVARWRRLLMNSSFTSTFFLAIDIFWRPLRRSHWTRTVVVIGFAAVVADAGFSPRSYRLFASGSLRRSNRYSVCFALAWDTEKLKDSTHHRLIRSGNSDWLALRKGIRKTWWERAAASNFSRDFGEVTAWRI